MDRTEQSIDIDVPAEAFYALITDFGRYPEFLDYVRETQVVAHEGETWEVDFTIQVIRRLQYRLHLTGTPFERLEWTLTEPGMFLKNEGGWRIESLADEQIRAHFRTHVEVGAFVPKAITQRLVSSSLPDMLAQWKARAEATYQEKNG